MTAVVFGVALGQAQRSWWFGVRMAAVAVLAVFLGPAILAAYGRSLQIFMPAVLIANGVFWTAVLLSTRPRPLRD